MITDLFYVKNDNRANLVKQFIRANMPTARFLQNPYRFNDGKWMFHISYEVKDVNKLNPLFNKWYEEDKKPIKEKFVMTNKVKIIIVGLLLNCIIAIILALTLNLKKFGVHIVYGYVLIDILWILVANHIASYRKS